MDALRRFLGLAAIPVIISILATPAVAHADTYQIFNLGSADRTDIVGITASGTAVLVYNVPVGAPQCALSNVCHEYETWVNGVMVSYSPTAPNFVYDNGGPCSVSAPFLATPVPGVCNNGHEIFNAGLAAPMPYTEDTFTGPDPVTELLASFPISVQNVDLNSSGDFAFNIFHPTGGSGQNELAIDLTTETPEPSSLLMLGTGLIYLTGSVRRGGSVRRH